MKKIDFKKITKKIIHGVKRIGSDADRDWRIFFSLFVIVFLISFAIHIQILLSIEGDKQNGASLAAAKTELINSTALSNLLSKYDERAADYQKISTSAGQIVDPAR